MQFPVKFHGLLRNIKNKVNKFLVLRELKKSEYNFNIHYEIIMFLKTYGYYLTFI